GTRTGSVRAVDRLGNVTTRDVSLGVPDAPRVLAVAVPAEAPADGRTRVRVLAFAATPEGKPEPEPSIAFGPAHPIAPGVGQAELSPRRELGEQMFEGRASGQAVPLRVRWVAGPPAAIEAGAWPDGQAGGWQVRARVVDEAGHVASPGPRVRA